MAKARAHWLSLTSDTDLRFPLWRAASWQREVISAVRAAGEMAGHRPGRGGTASGSGLLLRL